MRVVRLAEMNSQRKSIRGVDWSGKDNLQQKQNNLIGSREFNSENVLQKGRETCTIGEQEQGLRLEAK